MSVPELQEQARQLRRTQCASAASQHLVHGGTRIGGQVEAMGDLDGIGRALLAAFGVRAGAIADDDLDARVATEPVGEHVGRAIVEQIDRSVRLEIDEQRAITALLSA